MRGEDFGAAGDFLGLYFGFFGGIGLRGAVHAALGGGRVVWKFSFLGGVRVGGYRGYRGHNVELGGLI